MERFFAASEWIYAHMVLFIAASEWTFTAIIMECFFAASDWIFAHNEDLVVMVLVFRPALCERPVEQADMALFTSAFEWIYTGIVGLLKDLFIMALSSSALEWTYTLIVLKAAFVWI